MCIFAYALYIHAFLRKRLYILDSFYIAPMLVVALVLFICHVCDT